ncbi:MAG: CapA family protein [Ignavibacteria bacterium]|nr:CapA family protein [Ignavibacteria bacterium]
MLNAVAPALALVAAVLLFATDTRGAKAQRRPTEPPLTVLVAGDLLLDRGVRTQIRIFGADALLKDVTPLFADADAVIANLECPATDLRAPLEKRYIFRAEPAWLRALRASGLTHVVLANNHTIDQGRDGLISTAEHARARGLAPIGYGGTQDGACAPVLIARGAQRLAVFASVPLPLENWMYADTLPGPCQATAEQLAARIRAWKRAHAEDGILALLHWGREFHETPEPEQVAEAHALIDAGADAVVGHHPHVVQRVELYRGRPILYSVGNFVFDQRAPLASRALLARLDFRRGEGPEVSLLPLAISRCVPSPLSGRREERFRRDLESLSPGVRLARRDRHWRMRGAEHAAPVTPRPERP